MPTLLRPYTTIEEVQRETKNSAVELSEWYESCVNLASRMVEDKCQRDFWFHDHIATAYQVDRRRVLSDRVILPFPIITLTELRVFSDIEDDNNANDVYDADELFYVVGDRFIEAESENDWKTSQGKAVFGEYPFRGFLRVKGTFGYPLSTLPEDDPELVPPPTMPSEVRRACTLIAAALSDEMHKEQVGLDGVRVELLETAIPSEAKMLLSRWRDSFLTTF